MKDLTKILKVGDEVYCTLTGDYMKITDINSPRITGFPIQADSGTRTLYLTKAGHYYYNFPDAEPVIYPSKENRDWDACGEAEIQPLDLFADSGSLRFSECEVDFAYLCGVFNTSGIDGLYTEIQRLKELGKEPHDIVEACRKQ